MPIDEPHKKRIAREHLLNKSVCRRCGALNPPKAKKCRKCHGKDLRQKRKELPK
ncbi:MAG: 50S ribosomal protein L40e [Promethearchaeia archaeon]